MRERAIARPMDAEHMPPRRARMSAATFRTRIPRDYLEHRVVGEPDRTEIDGWKVVLRQRSAANINELFSQ